MRYILIKIASVFLQGRNLLNIEHNNNAIYNTF